MRELREFYRAAIRAERERMERQRRITVDELGRVNWDMYV